MHLLLCSSLVLAGSAYAATGARISLIAPSDSQPLKSTLVSFSLEQDRWPDWAGIDSRNEITHNALSNLAERTGTPPKIRVGADSEDRTLFDASIDIIESIYPQHDAITPYPEATNNSVGDRFYELSKYMPKGTHMTWGLNMGYDDAQNAINMAKSVMKTFNNGNQAGNTGVFLDLLELGNEADIFNRKVRPANWTVQEYVADWIKLMTPVVEVVDLSPGGPISVQACSFVGQGFRPSEAFEAGLLDSAPGKLVTLISQHLYSAAFCDGGDFQLRSFMTKSYIRGNISVFDYDIGVTKQKGLDYVFGETNSIACHGAPGVSNTAGAALWTIDYTLQAATHGISEVYFHEGIGYKYNFFQPVSLDRSPIDDSPLSTPLPPHAQPGYYAGIIITEAVGTDAGSGKTQIIEIELDAENVSGYAIYERGVLARAVFVNLNAWLVSDEGVRERETTHVEFDFALAKGSKVWQVGVRRLKIGHADDLEGLVWGGLSFETEDLLPQGTREDETVWWWEGVDVLESEAVMILF